MPTFPIILPVGVIAVYGSGDVGTMPSGVIIESNSRYGTVYNIWDGGATYVYGGDVVYWKEGNQVARIVTSDNNTYTLLPARLVTIDNLIPPP